MLALDSELLMTKDGVQRKPKLLIVDDQPHNINCYTNCFAGDYQVFMATSGMQGLTACREQRPDLMLVTSSWTAWMAMNCVARSKRTRSWQTSQ